MNATAESRREAVLDALATLMALNRGDVSTADQMYASYERCGDVAGFASAAYGIALLAIRHAATARGETPEALLAGVANEIRTAP